MVSAREVRSGWRYVGAPSASSNRVREDACGMLAPGPTCVCDRCSSNANGLCGRSSAGFPQIYATFQRDNLGRHF